MEKEILDTIKNKNGIPMTTSRAVAEYFDRSHKSILTAIDNHCLILKFHSVQVTEKFKHPRIINANVVLVVSRNHKKPPKSNLLPACLAKSIKRINPTGAQHQYKWRWAG